MTDYATYKVEPTHKKSMDEIYTYRHPDFSGIIEVEENYRWGEFHITPTSDEELKSLLNWDDDEFRPYDFEECELVEIFDQCYRDADCFGMDEDDFEDLREKTEEFDHMALEDQGWVSDYEIRITCPVSVEKIDD